MRMLTVSGECIDPLNVRSEQINITDIAHALSLQCRFAGHTSEFYSVAQHSVRVAMDVPGEYALEALLHDATEAYLSDIPKPLKNHLPEYVAIEERLHKVIMKRFGLPTVMSAVVKRADARVLAAEMGVQIRVPAFVTLDESVGKYGMAEIMETNWAPDMARMRFINLYLALIGSKAVV